MTCPICSAPIPRRDMLMCLQHWRMVPQAIARKVAQARGRLRKSPSITTLAALRVAQNAAIEAVKVAA